jgi:hypothetical protein
MMMRAIALDSSFFRGHLERSQENEKKEALPIIKNNST